MKRLFFALWPDDEAREQLDRINQIIPANGLRKLIPENLHTTLVFLGNVDDEIAVAIQQRAAEIVAPPIVLRFDELNFWPKPKVLCLTCRKQPETVYHIVNALTRIIADYPVRLEKRPYRAHITLARKAKKRPDITFDPLVINSESFVLVESISTEQGVRYKVLERWPLKG
ncbi:RNA 2',3'-cyclic phosphodiesterase [Methylophaga sp.]|uniref:RNA 2',3'-cyclic phosphodiesterase n=1 Tax=Methylophaga sp. TaxID=2024840 RepID=UPI003F69621B